MPTRFAHIRRNPFGEAHPDALDRIADEYAERVTVALGEVVIGVASKAHPGWPDRGDRIDTKHAVGTGAWIMRIEIQGAAFEIDLVRMEGIFLRCLCCRRLILDNDSPLL